MGLVSGLEVPRNGEFSFAETTRSELLEKTRRHVEGAPSAAWALVSDLSSNRLSSVGVGNDELLTAVTAVVG